MSWTKRLGGIPFMPGLATKTLPLSGYFFKSSLLKPILAVVINNLSRFGPPKMQDVIFGTGTSIL